ncbi:MAG: NAD(P)-binding protein, partial [Deltaproteobacteria bacterium]
MIAKLLERGGDLRESADVCVIGSGAGGAVAAAELARAGRSVVVLEQGAHWTKSDFTQREEEMLPRLFEEA